MAAIQNPSVTNRRPGRGYVFPRPMSADQRLRTSSYASRNDGAPRVIGALTKTRRRSSSTKVASYSFLNSRSRTAHQGTNVVAHGSRFVTPSSSTTTPRRRQRTTRMATKTTAPGAVIHPITGPPSPLPVHIATPNTPATRTTATAVPMFPHQSR